MAVLFAAMSTMRSFMMSVYSNSSFECGVVVTSATSHSPSATSFSSMTDPCSIRSTFT